MSAGRIGRFRLAIGAATLVMLGRSWRLWVGPGPLPRVPFLAGWPEPSGAWSWATFGALMVAIAMATAGVVPRRMLALAVAILAWLVVGDQHRFQPWAYQFLMAGLALATTAEPEAVRLNRLFLVALYGHSGLSKLDLAFAEGNGRVLLEAALKLFGLGPVRGMTGLALLMPAGELAIGLGLAWRPTRRAALAGAIAMHGALLGILGPWGLRQSFNVLAWNAALIAEDWALFGPGPEELPAARAGRWARATRLVFLLAVILPFGERWGWFDAWPSFALYAGHSERVEVEVIGLGDSFRPQRIDLTAWSLAARGTPAYPQARAGLGLAEALAIRYPGVRVRVVGRSAFGTGRRESVELLGRDAIRAFGRRYWLNARPAISRAGGTGNANRQAP